MKGKRANITYFIQLISCLLMPFGLTAQNSPTVALADALKALEGKYDVHFSYQRSLVHGISVSLPATGSGTQIPEKTLSQWLSPNGLTYKTISRGYYSIVKDPAFGIGKAGGTTAEKGGQIHGQVRNSHNGQAIPYATASLPALSLSTLTDQQGAYRFSQVPSGDYLVQIKSLGMLAQEKNIHLQQQSQQELNFLMEEEVLSLNEVQVVATEESGKGAATASRIDRQAIDHLQATSLADILQLVPGNLANNPNLTSVNQVALRQIGTDNVGSLGTSLIINGVPVSNNANLQLNNTPKSGVLAGYATTAGGGVDFRQFSADNVESVEVIRGIPSVEYGDLTSGAVVVKTKSGQVPFHLTARINPNLTQFAAEKGFSPGRIGGNLNINLDYTHALADQRFDVNSFDRYTASLQYEKSFFKNIPLQTNTNFTFGANIGQNKLDPDDPAQTMNKASNYSYRFNTSGQWNPGKPLARSLLYTFSADYTLQRGYEQELVGNNVYGIATSLVNAHAVPTSIVPGLYLSQMSVEGMPLNLYAKVTDRLYAKTGPFSHRILVGAEWRSESNKGAGKIYDLTRPPRLQAGAGTRPRPYQDIPGLQLFSIYAEDQSQGRIAGKTLYITAGLRYDNMDPHGLTGTGFARVLSPRINASYQLSRHLSIHGGYGISAKAPTLAYLYPQDAYFDPVNLNYFPDNPAERLILVSTYVYNRENPELHVAKSTKNELGFTWDDHDRHFTVIAYHEKTMNGYVFDNSLGTYDRYTVERYTVAAKAAGQPPIVDPMPARIDTFFTDYTIPTNHQINLNRGIEFDADLGQIQDIRTSFVISGAWMQSRQTSAAPYFLKLAVTGETEQNRVGIYPEGRGSENTRFNTTLRAIHHIPQFRLVATLTIQTIWKDEQKYINYDSRAIGYLSKQSGQVTWLTPEESAALDPAKLSDDDITQDISPEYYLTESWKPLWLFNLRLSKEIGRSIGFSFYANNIFMNRPLEESTRWAGQYTRRNQAFFFGAELSVKIK
ncbi:TonB dependent receptor [bacterium A37T11]|nr:TonB dependent receptor [bacterium A37T11]